MWGWCAWSWRYNIIEVDGIHGGVEESQLFFMNITVLLRRCSMCNGAWCVHIWTGHELNKSNICGFCGIYCWLCSRSNLYFIKYSIYIIHHRLADPDSAILDVLEAVRPHLELTFDNILAHIDTIYVLKTKTGALAQQGYLRLKVNYTSTISF